MTKEQAFEASKMYFNGDELAAKTFVDKYAMETNGDFEATPTQMHERMAKEYARIEEKFGGKHQLDYQTIFNLFDHFKYIVPGGSVCSGLGNPNYVGSLSNCFVAGQPEDSYCSIMKYRNMQVQLMKRRGGVGIDLSKLRPEGTKVNNAAKSSTGPVSFMTCFSELTKEVALNGRRGALMISISGNHPDVFNADPKGTDFINCKQDLTKITGANISIKFSDAFMQAVVDDKDYFLRWPVDLTEDEVNNLLRETYFPLPPQMDMNTKYWFEEGKICLMRVHAKDVWNKFIHCAWNTAEPGIMYEDRHINMSPDGVYEQYKFISTNPCGEVGMSSLDSCRLMHINLASFVNKETKEFDYDLLETVAYQNMQLCDDLVELELEHVQQIIDHIQSTYIEDNREELELWQKIYEVGSSSRRAGCGATGIADAVALMGLKLGTPESYTAIEKMFKTKMRGELKAQVDMAEERGTFKGYDFYKEFDKVTGKGTNAFFKLLSNDSEILSGDLFEQMKAYGRRNVSWSTMAPVGTGAIMTQGSSGVEPVFKVLYKRRKKCMNPDDRVDYVDEAGEKFTEFNVIHHTFKQWVKDNFKVELTENTPYAEAEQYFKQSPWHGCEAGDLSPEQHVDLQALVQKYTSHSISKCVVPDTLIETNNGFYYIDELTLDKPSENQFTDLTEHALNAICLNNEQQKITKYYNNGIKSVFTVNLLNGINLTCTPNEKLLTFDEKTDNLIWKEMQELKEGDIIILK